MSKIGYGYGNRLAALQFLVREEVSARLLFIYFLGDSFRDCNVVCPKRPDDWTGALRGMYVHLGLQGKSPLEARVHKLFLDVCPGRPAPG